MPGVVSPHELLQKLQLVQQEQNQASHDSLSLAPQFQGAAPSSVLGSVPNQITGQKVALQYQVSAVALECVFVFVVAGSVDGDVYCVLLSLSLSLCPSRSSPPSGYQPLWPPPCSSPPVRSARPGQQFPRMAAPPPQRRPTPPCRHSSESCPEASSRPRCCI